MYAVLDARLDWPAVGTGSHVELGLAHSRHCRQEVEPAVPSIQMARRGLRVIAVDSAVSMLARAMLSVAAAGLSESVTPMPADAERLPRSSNSVRLVVALGLAPWLPHPQIGLAEMLRTLTVGGHLIVNCDNRHRLAALLGP